MPRPPLLLASIRSPSPARPLSYPHTPPLSHPPSLPSCLCCPAPSILLALIQVCVFPKAALVEDRIQSGFKQCFLSVLEAQCLKSRY